MKMFTLVKQRRILAALLIMTLGAGGTLKAQGAADSIKISKPSPTGALLRSLVVPGWGQLYNKKYIKAAIIGLGEGLLIYQTAYYWERTTTYRDLYLNEPDDRRRAVKFSQYDRYRDLRNQHIWFLAIAVFYSMFDAYVDAHLKNFDIDLTPGFDENHSEIILQLRIGCTF